jgi:predicted nucleic acid-binding protein
VEAVTRQVLLEDAAERWLREEATYSELAVETGLWIEEIMQAVTRRTGDRAVTASLQDWQALAEEHQRPDLFRLA